MVRVWGLGLVGLTGRGSGYGWKGRRLDVALLLLKQGKHVLGGLERDTFPRVLLPLLSLAVHPDGVRVASGQTAGVDKDGKVMSTQNIEQIG